jgi:hypothetical protein
MPNIQAETTNIAQTQPATALRDRTTPLLFSAPFSLALANGGIPHEVESAFSRAPTF